MKAMIFAAGLGTRLRPYTNDRPKALVEVGGTPLLGIQLQQLHQHGFTDIVVNVHHHADMVEDYLAQFDNGGMRIHISDERDLLRDTGGGLLHALPFLDGHEPIYLCNVDVLSDLDPRRLLQAHREADALATLGLLQRPTSRVLTLDTQMRLSGWRNLESGQEKGQPDAQDSHWAFCGLHVIQPQLLHACTRTGVFSVIDLYLDHASTQRIIGVNLQGTQWLDVGKPEALPKAEAMLPGLFRKP